MARRPRRTSTAEFKAMVVLGVLTGTTSAAEACREHQLSPTLLAVWKATYLERLPVVVRADERQSAEAARVADLERLVGQQALELAALKKSRRGPSAPRAAATSRAVSTLREAMATGLNPAFA